MRALRTAACRRLWLPVSSSQRSPKPGSKYDASVPLTSCVRLLLLEMVLICHRVSVQTFHACAHVSKGFPKLVSDRWDCILTPPLDITSIAPCHVSLALWALSYLSHHTFRLSVALRTLPGEVPTKRQSSLRGVSVLTASLLLPALELLKEAIDKAGYTDKIVIGMDVAASEFYRDGKYDLDFKSPDDPSRYISADELGDLYQSFVRDYPGELLGLAVGDRR